jgi:RNA polymerase sigma-70 factor (ECF subfamily)
MPQTNCRKDDGTSSRSINTDCTVDATQVDDDELVKRVCMGETQVFRLLIERHQQHIFNLCYRMLQQLEDAEDATQEIFLKAYDSLKAFRGESRLKTWLCRIARNECLNRLRHEPMVSLDEPFDESSTTAEGFQVVDSAPSPLELIEQEETKSAVHAAINELPPQYRWVITLFHLNELSYDEIAQVMEVQIGTVKTHLFRARELLKSKLKAFVEGKM